MSFFDKKEEVLDLVLTPYGRHKLSRGQLMPKYYSFLDDDVTYDIASMTGSAETEQNHQIKSRILKNTPSLKPIATFNSLETILTTTYIGLDSLSITLIHEPNKSGFGVSDGDITNAGGSVNLMVSFPINVTQ